MMSILSKSSSGSNTSAPSFHEFRKQASFFFKEKIKSARLALTDVTPAQLLTEEATNENLRIPDARTLGSISRAAFEVDDYWRIVEILHNRLAISCFMILMSIQIWSIQARTSLCYVCMISFAMSQTRFLRFERKNWKASYNSLIVLEHLLTHGPESTAGEFQNDKDVIREMESFQFIDEKGFNWGLALRKKSERTLELLEKGSLYKEEREKARKLTRGIQGFGSFCQRPSSAQGILLESSRGTFARSNSQFNNSEENQLLSPKMENLILKAETSQKNHGVESFELSEIEREIDSCDSFSRGWTFEKPETSFKENMAPVREEMHTWNHAEEDNPLLGGRREEPMFEEQVHPFNESENHQTAEYLLSERRENLQGC